MIPGILFGFTKSEKSQKIGCTGIEPGIDLKSVPKMDPSERPNAPKPFEFIAFSSTWDPERGTGFGTGSGSILVHFESRPPFP